MDAIYLDHNSTTPLYPEALEAMMPFLKENFGNASSIHQAGQRARKAIEEARAVMASFVGADDPSEIIFTSGGTEANNMAIKGAFTMNLSKGKRIITSAIEHSAVRNVIRHLAETEGADNVVIPVQSNGIVRPADVDEAITPDTALVTIMAVNNELGTIQPIAEIAKLSHQKNVLMHTDAVQMAGKMAIRVKELGVDMLSLSGHKFGGPKGNGILYLRKGTRLATLIQGGRQEKNRRGGTENAAGIVGMAAAARVAQSHLGEEVERLKKLRDVLEREILTTIPCTSVNGDKNHRIGNTSNICFEYTDSSEAVMALDLKGISTSNGSACAAGSPDPSHVLLALGLPQEKAHGSLRFSVGHTTTEEDIRRAVPLISETMRALREAHPLWKKAGNQ